MVGTMTLTKREKLLGCAFIADICYVTRVDGWHKPGSGGGITRANWEELRALAAAHPTPLGDDPLLMRITELVGKHYHTTPPNTGFLVRLAAYMRAQPDLRMVAQLENSPAFDGECTIFRNGSSIIVAWRGTDSLADVMVDLEMGMTHWASNKEELQKLPRSPTAHKDVRVHLGFVKQYLLSVDAVGAGSGR